MDSVGNQGPMRSIKGPPQKPVPQPGERQRPTPPPRNHVQQGLSNRSRSAYSPRSIPAPDPRRRATVSAEQIQTIQNKLAQVQQTRESLISSTNVEGPGSLDNRDTVKLDPEQVDKALQRSTSSESVDSTSDTQSVDGSSSSEETDPDTKSRRSLFKALRRGVKKAVGSISSKIDRQDMSPRKAQAFELMQDADALAIRSPDDLEALNQQLDKLQTFAKQHPLTERSEVNRHIELLESTKQLSELVLDLQSETKVEGSRWEELCTLLNQETMQEAIGARLRSIVQTPIDQQQASQALRAMYDGLSTPIDQPNANIAGISTTPVADAMCAALIAEMGHGHEGKEVQDLVRSMVADDTRGASMDAILRGVEFTSAMVSRVLKAQVQEPLAAPVQTFLGQASESLSEGKAQDMIRNQTEQVYQHVEQLAGSALATLETADLRALQPFFQGAMDGLESADRHEDAAKLREEVLAPMFILRGLGQSVTAEIAQPGVDAKSRNILTAAQMTLQWAANGKVTSSWSKDTAVNEASSKLTVQVKQRLLALTDKMLA